VAAVWVRRFFQHSSSVVSVFKKQGVLQQNPVGRLALPDLLPIHYPVQRPVALSTAVALLSAAGFKRFPAMTATPAHFQPPCLGTDVQNAGWIILVWLCRSTRDLFFFWRKRVGGMARVGLDAMQFPVQVATPLPDEHTCEHQQTRLRQHKNDHDLHRPTGDNELITGEIIHAPIIPGNSHVSTLF
jgi:hypothetical protein